MSKIDNTNFSPPQRTVPPNTEAFFAKVVTVGEKQTLERVLKSKKKTVSSHAFFKDK